MDETVARTRIGRQFSGAGKLQALYNSLHIIIAQSNTQKCFEWRVGKGDWELRRRLRFCQRRWGRRVGLRVWRRWWRVCSPGRSSGCLWLASCPRCSSLFIVLLVQSRIYVLYKHGSGGNEGRKSRKYFGGVRGRVGTGKGGTATLVQWCAVNCNRAKSSWIYMASSIYVSNSSCTWASRCHFGQICYFDSTSNFPLMKK